jgi:hypothetical protein
MRNQPAMHYGFSVMIRINPPVIFVTKINKRSQRVDLTGESFLASFVVIALHYFYVYKTTTKQHTRVKPLSQMQTIGVPGTLSHTKVCEYLTNPYAHSSHQISHHRRNLKFSGSMKSG